MLPAYKKILEHFRGEKIILHCCGNTLDRIGLFAKAGFGIYHFESKNDISRAIELAGSMVLTGCVNNADVLLNGRREDVAAQVRDIVSAGIRLVSPECAVPLKVRNENLAEIVDTVKKYAE